MEKYKRNPNTTCVICKKAIYKRPCEIKLTTGNVFCSQACYGISNRKEHPCAVCKAPILASMHKKTCSRACANTHRAGIKYKISRPKDKVVSHQAIRTRLLRTRGEQCERCSYSVSAILQVHHKDHSRKNNDLSNLELICPNCHYEEHLLKRKN